jgi:PRTRC genetic system protein E
MFTALQALAQKATLMVDITAEGDLLRVSITPTSSGKDPSQPLRPLSLLATPEELDATFTEALHIWQAPHHLLIEKANASGTYALRPVAPDDPVPPLPLKDPSVDVFTLDLF